MRQSIRFWTVWNNAPVRMKIRCGQRLCTRQIAFTEEGFVRDEMMLQFDGKRLEQHFYTKAQDCDGPIETFHVRSCEHDQLEVVPGENGIHYPEWEAQESWNRDYYAEAMGY